MKKVFLPIAAVIIVLLVGAVFVKSSTVEIPPKKKNQEVIPVPTQRNDDGKIVMEDSEEWDKNKGFSITYMVVE